MFSTLKLFSNVERSNYVD